MESGPDTDVYSYFWQSGLRILDTLGELDAVVHSQAIQMSTRGSAALRPGGAGAASCRAVAKVRQRNGKF